MTHPVIASQVHDLLTYFAWQGHAFHLFFGTVAAIASIWFGVACVHHFGRKNSPAYDGGGLTTCCGAALMVLGLFGVVPIVVVDAGSIPGEVAQDELVLKNGFVASLTDDDQTLHVEGIAVPGHAEQLLGTTVHIPDQPASFDLSLDQARKLSAAMIASDDAGLRENGRQLAAR